MTAVLVLLALAGAWVAIAATRELLSRDDLGDPPHRCFALAVVVLGVLHQSELLPPTSVLQVGLVAVCGAAVLLVLCGPPSWRSRPAPARGWAVGLVFLLWLDLYVTNTVQNHTLTAGALLERLLPGVFWVCALLLWLAGGLSRDLLALVVALTLGAVAVTFPFVSRATRPCDEFKCNVLGELVRGPFSSENYPAMVAALTLVLVVTCRVGRVRWPGVVLCAGLLAATGGRSSLVGAVVGLVSFLLLRRRDTVRGTGAAPALAALLPGGAAVVGVAMVYLADREDLSNRGAIWVKARDALDGHELFGLGISRWSGYGQYRAISAHFPHSLYLLVLFCGGLVALALLVGALTAAILAAGSNPRDLAGAVAYTATFGTIGVSEIVLNVLSVDGLTWALLPVLATGARTVPSAAAVATAPVRPARGRTPSATPVSTSPTTAPAPGRHHRRQGAAG